MDSDRPIDSGELVKSVTDRHKVELILCVAPRVNQNKQQVSDVERCSVMGKVLDSGQSGDDLNGLDIRKNLVY